MLVAGQSNLVNRVRWTTTEFYRLNFVDFFSYSCFWISTPNSLIDLICCFACRFVLRTLKNAERPLWLR